MLLNHIDQEAEHGEEDASDHAAYPESEAGSTIFSTGGEGCGDGYDAGQKKRQSEDRLC